MHLLGSTFVRSAYVVYELDSLQVLKVPTRYNKGREEYNVSYSNPRKYGSQQSAIPNLPILSTRDFSCANWSFPAVEDEKYHLRVLFYFLLLATLLHAVVLESNGTIWVARVITHNLAMMSTDQYY